MENGADKKEITAKKLAEGQVLTQISGNGADVLQMLAMRLCDELNISLSDFKENHPGGHIGEELKNV